MPYSIKGDLEVARELTVGDLTYPATPGSTGQALFTDGLGSLSFQDATLSKGVASEDPGPAHAGRYGLDPSGSGFFFTLPSATGGHSVVDISGHDVPVETVVVRPQPGEALNGVTDGTYVIGNSGGQYLALDREAGSWECIRIDRVGHLASEPLPDWAPWKSYAPGEAAIVRGVPMFSFAGHTSGPVLNLGELKSWRTGDSRVGCRRIDDENYGAGVTYKELIEYLDFDSPTTQSSIAQSQGVNAVNSEITLPSGRWTIAVNATLWAPGSGSATVTLLKDMATVISTKTESVVSGSQSVQWVLDLMLYEDTNIRMWYSDTQVLMTDLHSVVIEG